MDLLKGRTKELLTPVPFFPCAGKTHNLDEDEKAQSFALRNGWWWWTILLSANTTFF